MSKLSNAWKHFCTITRHRHLVMRHCFQVGLIHRGLLHDLSKYSWTEFRTGMRYYQGTRSPNAAEREAEGCSKAWMHHKGRNKHHFEYWTDLLPGTREYSPVPMPTPYLVEMVMDRIAACKVYKGKAYTDSAPLEYLERALDSALMHEETVLKLRYILTVLEQQGEKKTFRFIRQTVLKSETIADWPVI